MEIIGKKNLSLVKRALLGHIVNCSIKATRATDQETAEIYDPEIADTQELLKAVDLNLDRDEEG